MKKNSIMIFMLMFLFFSFGKFVYAEEKYSCSYNVQFAEGGYFNIKAVVNSDGTSDVLYQADESNWKSTKNYKLGDGLYYSTSGKYQVGYPMIFSLSYLKSDSFSKAMSSSKLTTDCPVINVQFDNSSMYYFYFSDTSSEAYSYNIQGKLTGSKGSSAIAVTETKTCPFTISTEKITGMKEFTIYTEFKMKSDGTKLICAASKKENVQSSCTPYTTNDYATNINFNGDYYTLNIKSADLSSIYKQSTTDVKNNTFTCPTAMYLVYTSVTDSTLLLTTDKSVADDYNKNVIGNASSGANENPENSTPKEDDSEKYYTGCPLGEDVTKDLYGLLKIVKILAPILVIGLTILEFVRSIAKGEIDGEAKKLGIRFVKRLIIAVILFFLPVLVNQVMIMANIWDESGTCDFSKSVTETVSSSTSSTSTSSGTSTSGYVNTYAKCETRNESENMCLSAPSNKCYWDDTLEDGNKCQYRNKSDKCDEKCSPTHLKGTDKYNVCFDACMNK